MYRPAGPIDPRVRELWALKHVIAASERDCDLALKVAARFLDEEPVKTFAACMIVCEGISRYEQEAIEHLLAKIKAGDKVDSLSFLLTLEALQRFPQSMLQDEAVLELLRTTADRGDFGSNIASLILSKLE